MEQRVGFHKVAHDSGCPAIVVLVGWFIIHFASLNLMQKAEGNDMSFCLAGALIIDATSISLGRLGVPQSSRCSGAASRWILTVMFAVWATSAMSEVEHWWMLTPQPTLTTRHEKAITGEKAGKSP